MEPVSGGREAALQETGSGPRLQPGPAKQASEGAVGKRALVAPPPEESRQRLALAMSTLLRPATTLKAACAKCGPIADFRTYCKGRWVSHSLLHVFGTEFQAQPLAYYEAAVRAGRLHLNGEPVQDLNIVLKSGTHNGACPKGAWFFGY